MHTHGHGDSTQLADRRSVGYALQVNEQKKPRRRRRWIVVVLFLLAAYVLSIGPEWQYEMCLDPRRGPSEVFFTIYAPLKWIGNQSPTFAYLILKYIDMWDFIQKGLLKGKGIVDEPVDFADLVDTYPQIAAHPDKHLKLSVKYGPQAAFDVTSSAENDRMD